MSMDNFIIEGERVDKRENERRERKRERQTSVTSQQGIDTARNIIRHDYSESINKQGWYAKNTYKEEIHNKIEKYGFMTQRIARENAYYTNNFMNLRELVSGLVENNPELSKVTLKYFLDNPYTKNTYEKYLYYLHFLIIFSDPKDVDLFLGDYCYRFGKEMMRMFINYPLVCHFSKNIITPLICAMLWCTDPQMLRVLYAWGADVSFTDVHNNYCEDIYSGHCYYYNHLHPFVISRHVILGVRNVAEFAPMRKEMGLLSKEEIPKNDSWYFPELKV